MCTRPAAAADHEQLAVHHDLQLLALVGSTPRPNPAAVEVQDICSSLLATVSPTDTVEDAVRVMRDKAIRRLPVVENGRPVGVVSIGDLAIERDPDSALSDISAAPPND